MLKTYKKRNGSICLCDYFVMPPDSCIVYGILNDKWNDDIRKSLLVFDIRYEKSLLDQIKSDYKFCETQEVLTHENFWLLPPTIIASIKAQKHA